MDLKEFKRAGIIYYAKKLGDLTVPYENIRTSLRYKNSGNEMVNPFQPNFAYHIETSYLICIANQMTVFYMLRNTWLEWVDKNTWVKILKN